MPDSSTYFVGNLARDPELRFTPGGKAQALGAIAVSRRWQAGGDWHEQTSFFNFVAWEGLAERLAASAVKGDRVILIGRLEQRSYETKEGDKRTAIELIVEEAGPSLKWRGAEIERTERETTREPRQKPESPDYGDEEPF